jgi:hypothetical protein
MREECTLRACETMVLRRILGLWNESRGKGRREHADEFHDLHYSKIYIIRVIK